MNLFNNKSDKKGLTLVLAEKADQAMGYAKVLNCKEGRNGYIQGPDYIITYASGQLFTLKEPEDYNPDLKKWNIDQLPIIPEHFDLKPRQEVRKMNAFRTIRELVKRDDIEKIIVATDAAREGELIARYILQEVKNTNPVYRVWLSTCNEKDIKKAFDNPEPLSKYDKIYQSAFVRAKLDWIIGKNFSRAYTLKSSMGQTLTAGRCQTAVLALICKRDQEIQSFESEAYFELYANFSPGYKGKYIKDKDSKSNTMEELELIGKKIEGENGKIKYITEETKKIPHPFLFNLTDLDREMVRKYGYTLKQTEDAAQKLYEEHKIISYARTESRHIKENMVSILPERIERVKFGPFENAAKYCLGLKKLPITKRIADDSMVTDHFAILPLDNENMEEIYKNLSKIEKDVFDEIVFRFLACFYGDYIYKSKTINTEVKGYEFIARGQEVTDLGWKAINKSNNEIGDDPEVPKLKIGQTVNVRNVEINKNKTVPPPRYDEDLLLKVMDNPGGLMEEAHLRKAIKGHGIGTVATRKDIIETLIEREYIARDHNKLYATPLGKYLIELIDIDFLKNPEFTAELEYNLECIISDGKDPEVFLRKMIELIIKAIEHIKATAEKKDKIEKQAAMKLGICPYCNTGQVFVNERGYGCTKWEEGCKFFITKTYLGVNIEFDHIKKLCEDGETDFIEGFQGKKEKFTAALVANKINRKIDFKYKNKS